MTSSNTLVALAGQPNCGKSTVFNALTGANQHVANYPGVTVDKMVGWFRQNGTKLELIDLPGTYSLTSYSPEERVTRDFLLHDKPAVVINVADASNLKRNLYLTFQLFEMEVPLILNLNMMDVAEKRDMEIDVDKLTRRLNMRVAPTSMKTGEGKKDLLDAVLATAFDSQGSRPGSRVDYGELESFVRELVDDLSRESALGDRYPLRWLAVKLLEGDREAQSLLADGHPDAARVLSDVEAKQEAFEAAYGSLPAQQIARKRYQAAADVARSVVKQKAADGRPWSDRVDAVVCNRYWGPAFLVGVIYLLYYLLNFAFEKIG